MPVPGNTISLRPGGLSLSAVIVLVLWCVSACSAPPSPSNSPANLGLCDHVSAPCIENGVIAITHFRERDRVLLDAAENVHQSLFRVSSGVGVPIVVAREDTVSAIVGELKHTPFTHALTVRWLNLESSRDLVSSRLTAHRGSNDSSAPPFCSSQEDRTRYLYVGTRNERLVVDAVGTRSDEFEQVLRCMWRLHTGVL